MANEIKMQASLAINTTNFSESFQPGAISIDLAQGEALGVDDVTVGGVCFFRNLDETNYVEIGFQVSSTFYPFLKLLPGEFSVGRLGNAAPYARANTANVNLQYRLLSP